MCAIVFESPNQMYALVFHIVGIKLYNLKNMTPIVMPIVTCRGSVQKKFELIEIALADYNK